LRSWEIRAGDSWNRRACHLIKLFPIGQDRRDAMLGYTRGISGFVGTAMADSAVIRRL
jgi:hypothetical protein